MSHMATNACIDLTQTLILVTRQEFAHPYQRFAPTLVVKAAAPILVSLIS
jgi:hypothetical protein